MNEKIKVPELKNCLLELFSSYGEACQRAARVKLKNTGKKKCKGTKKAKFRNCDLVQVFSHIDFTF